MDSWRVSDFIAKLLISGLPAHVPLHIACAALPFMYCSAMSQSSAGASLHEGQDEAARCTCDDVSVMGGAFESFVVIDAPVVLIVPTKLHSVFGHGALMVRLASAFCWYLLLDFLEPCRLMVYAQCMGMPRCFESGR